MSRILTIYHQMCEKNGWNHDSDQKQALQALARMEDSLTPKSFLQKFKRSEDSAQAIYMYGGVGRGKTFVMDFFFQHAQVSKRQRLHFHEFMIDVHARLHQRRINGERKTMGNDLHIVAQDIAKETRLLCLDELFVEDVADAMLLSRLFKSLFDVGVRVVFTSNTAPSDLYPDGLQRERFLPFISLIKETADIIHFTGSMDYRMDKMRDHKRYSYPTSPAANDDLLQMFKDILDGDAPIETAIDVKGREVFFGTSAKGVLLSDFNTLCVQALGAEDYLVLSKHYSTVIICNIPALDDTLRNETRRFMSLVDTLYEKKRLVFFTAEKPIELLYTGQQYQKTFQRTQSRVLEMQSPEYPS